MGTRTQRDLWDTRWNSDLQWRCQCNAWPFFDEAFAFPWIPPFSLLPPVEFVPAGCDLVPHYLSLQRKKKEEKKKDLILFVCTSQKYCVFQARFLGEIKLTQWPTVRSHPFPCSCSSAFKAASKQGLPVQGVFHSHAAACILFRKIHTKKSD